MTQDEIEEAKQYLGKATKFVDDNKIEWFAISLKFNDGGRMTIHSKGAPKRPKGIS